MTNAFTARLGLEHPIIQAPMAGVQGHALAVAVSNADGLGSLPCAMLSLEALHDELTRIHAGTSAAYNVNFFCHTPPTPDAAREARWRAALSPYYAEYGIDAAAIPAGAGRVPFTQAAADVLAEFRPRVVSFHFGLPSPELLARVRAWDAMVLSSATTVDEARWLKAHGADAIIAQGVEAGGHRGMFLTGDLATQVSTFDLVRDVVAAVSVPVIAAGGIANADDVARAMSLGASAVQVGTAYMLCPEATTSEMHRVALKHTAPYETALTNLFTGRPARGIVNRVMRELGAMSAAAPAFPLATAAIAPVRAAAEKKASSDFSPLWSGTNAPQFDGVAAIDVTRALCAELRN
jgi:nitronate monooxygenase